MFIPLIQLDNFYANECSSVTLALFLVLMFSPFDKFKMRSDISKVH